MYALHDASSLRCILTLQPLQENPCRSEENMQANCDAEDGWTAMNGILRRPELEALLCA